MSYVAQSWSPRQRKAALAALAGFALLACAPAGLGASALDKLTTLFAYALIASSWNLLAGYAGLVSIGQQAYFGLSGYFALRLVSFGAPPYAALIAGAFGAAAVAAALSPFLLRLREGEFAIGSWVMAEVIRYVVMFDPLVQGETGTSLLALNGYDPHWRTMATYWLALASLAAMLTAMLWLLRSRLGQAGRAVRDDEEAAKAVGVDVAPTRRAFYVIAALGAGLAGSVWLAGAITFLPSANFGVEWTVFMLFMTLVGGLGTFEGPIVGAVLFFALQEAFGDYGAYYLFSLGVLAVVAALALPAGIVGTLEARFGLRLFGAGERLLKSGDKTA